MSTRKHIDVSFRPTKEDNDLYARIVKTKPKGTKLAEHAREKLRKGLDCTCSTVKPKVTKSSARVGKRCPGDGQK